MARYIDVDKLIEELQEELDFKTAMCTEEQNYYFNAGLKYAMRNIKSQPSADVIPKSEVAREIIAKFKTKMHSEIARNELLAEYGDDFYEGRINAFLTAIECFTEIAMEYSEDKNDT